MKLLRILIFISICISLQNCKESNEKNSDSQNKNLLELLEKANNVNLEKAQRLKYAATAYDIIRDKKYDSIVRKQYSQLSATYSYLNEKKQFLNVSRDLIAKAESNKDYEIVGTTNYNLGAYYYLEFKIDSAYLYYTKAEKAFKKGNHDYIEYILNAKATILWLKKDFVGAEVMSIKALEIAQKSQDHELIHNCYITIGNALVGVKNYSKALEYYKKALKETEKISKNRQNIYKASAYSCIGLMYQKENKHLQAISFFQKGLADRNLRSSDIKIYCYLTNNLAYSKFKLGDKSSVLKFQETLKIADSIKNSPIQITSKTYLGEFYLSEKDTLKANNYFKEAQKQSHENDLFDDELKIFQLLAQSSPNEKSFYSDRYIKLNDSLQDVERITRNKFARIEFETDEITAEKDILSLEKKNLMFQRWLIAGFSIFLLITAFLWFKNKSQKSKTRELMMKQEQQRANEEIYQLMLSQQHKIEQGKNSEKQRMSLELHDGVMGKLSAVRLNLYASLYKANLLDDKSISDQIDEIQMVEKEIRNIAHDLNSNLFSDNSNFIEIVKELFSKIENHSQIEFDLQVSDAVNWELINTTIKINLYRILQEALQNIEKYADAKHVTVIMNKTHHNEIQVFISDDGNGFVILQKKEGIGIKNMRFRISELNGRFQIESELKKGTKINLIIPF